MDIALDHPFGFILRALIETEILGLFILSDNLTAEPMTAAAPKSDAKAENKAPSHVTIIDDDIDMAMELDGDIEMPIDANIGSDMGSDMGGDINQGMQAKADTDATVAFELDTSPPEGPDMNVGDDLDSVGDRDDITIPKVGQAPPPQKSRFFSASWLQKEAKSVGTSPVADASQMSHELAPEGSEVRAAASECARLAEIERKLMALRELYEAGLIAPEVYVLKAREFAAQVG